MIHIIKIVRDLKIVLKHLRNDPEINMKIATNEYNMIDLDNSQSDKDLR